MCQDQDLTVAMITAGEPESTLDRGLHASGMSGPYKLLDHWRTAPGRADLLRPLRHRQRLVPTLNLLKRGSLWMIHV